MTTLDDIKRLSRLGRLRMGQDAPVLVTLGSTNGAEEMVRVALVPLTGFEDHLCLMEAASLPLGDNDDNPYGREVRDHWMRLCTLYHAIRDPSDLTKKIYSSVDELANHMEAPDVNHLSERYMEMMADSSPGLDSLTEEQMDELKKALERIDLSVLSGKSLYHLSGLVMSLPANQPLVKLPGSSSTTNLMTRNDESEPISIVNQS